MPSSKPNAWWVVMITIGFTIGAAIRNVSVSGTVNPRMSRPRANGTLPHSHTGMNMPSSDSTARRAHARRGIHRSITPGGTHTCTTIESTTPSTTNGSDSISTLIASVRPSCARVGRDAGKSAGANASIRNSARMTTTDAERDAGRARRRRIGRAGARPPDARSARASAQSAPRSSARARRARRAQAEDVDDVLGLGEAVASRRSPRPLLDVGRLDLDGQSARAADQVVVVARARARAVERFALGALQRVGLALGGEAGERAVDGGQADAGVLVAERGVQALRAHEAGRIGERLAHSLALPRVALSHVGSLPAACASAGWEPRARSTRPRRAPMTRHTT